MLVDETGGSCVLSLYAHVEDPRASSRRVAGSAEASTSQYGAYSGCRVGGEMAGATREIRPPAGMSTLPSAARPKQSLGAMLIQSGASAQGAQAWHEDELGEGAGEAGYGGRSVHNSYGGGGRGGVQTAGVERDTGVGPQRPGSGASTQRSSRQGAPSGFKGVKGRNNPQEIGTDSQGAVLTVGGSLDIVFKGKHESASMAGVLLVHMGSLLLAIVENSWKASALAKHSVLDARCQRVTGCTMPKVYARKGKKRK
eukprot:scaffold316092_cov15-Tisochrysis_lutea.AAC.1